MSLLKQAIIVFIVIHIIFGYFHYRYKEDIFYVLEQSIKPKYLLPSVIITLAYIFLVVFLRYLFG